MEKFWPYAPWLSRALLLIVALLFARLSLPAIVDPVREASSHGISLASPEAVSRVRAGFGSTLLAAVVVAVICLISPRRVLTGLYFVLIWVGVITVVRAIAILINGPNDFDLLVLRPEIVILVLTVLCIFLERARQRRESARLGIEEARLRA
jgi:hypothetical protein